MGLNKAIYVAILVCLWIHSIAGNSSVKKALNESITMAGEEKLKSLETKQSDDHPDKTPVKSENTLTEMKNVKQKSEAAEISAIVPEKHATVGGQIYVDESDIKHKFSDIDVDFSGSFQTGFYMFLGLSSAAVLFIVIKLYRLRLSRAERKYGVQGDRTTQELTPLPVSIDDSDEDDHTLFEVNRQQIRIL